MASLQRLVRHDGNNDLFRALEMSVAALHCGHPFHLHAEGLRGTGKTTIMRAVKELLPSIVRIKGCLYNCQPDKPHCPEHRVMSAEQIAGLGIESVPCPFLEISHSAKLGTVVGSIDLARLTDRNNPGAALLPGTIAQAHRGIIFIDEINRLADTSPELADVLLDVMGTKPGRLQIEETGLPAVELPVAVTIWAASNPDEDPGALAQIRKQLSDRFDIAVMMGRPQDSKAVYRILGGKEGEGNSNSSPYKFISSPELNRTRLSDEIRKTLATIYVDFGIESLRAVEALETAALLNSTLEGRTSACNLDVAQVTPFVLGHRADATTVTNIMKYLHSLDNTGNMSRAELTESSPNKLTPSPVDKRMQSPNMASNWWNKLRNLFGTATPQTNKSSEHKGEGQQNKNGGATAGGNQVLDPMQTLISAPPTQAVPLAKLPVDQYVSTEERSHG